jgi:hypothetical protein
MDNGSLPITAYATTAFSILEVPNNKQFQMVRATINGPDGLSPGVGVHIDYDTSNISVFGQSYTAGGTDWDTALWDTFGWAGGGNISRNWQTIGGIGSAVSLEMQVSTTDRVVLHSFDIMFEQGGYL